MRRTASSSPLLLPLLLASLAVLASCSAPASEDAGPTLFAEKDPDSTGVAFSNDLAESTDLNILNYLYYYNGGGVAVGDVNGDDRPDLYFTSNEEDNRLYLNRGDFRFEDVTETAGVAGSADWTSGVTMADVNGDDRLDLYVSVVDGYEGLEGVNQLFVNQGTGEDGVPRFEEKAAAYGLDFRGYGTQASFFDYDGDGDLDVYLLNHSTHYEGTYRRRAEIVDERHPDAGDRLMENRDGQFVDVSEEAGIHSSRIGYGLGVVASDLNSDGCIDIYVANDFHENDYLYRNNCDGTFTETLPSSIRHTSLSSMGTDAADLNNDGRPDVAVLDMLPDRPDVRMVSGDAESSDVYAIKRRYGYHPQVARNMLHLNQGNGRYSDVGYLAGLESTDWSWSVLLADFDLDGRKDFFISNGIYRRPNDLDYVNYASNRAIQADLDRGISKENLELLNRMPKVPVPNYAFRNADGLDFEDVSSKWGLDHVGFSNGAAYADFDGDGDLDLVTNNINEAASIYENRADRLTNRRYLRVELDGDGKNTDGIGARVTLVLEDGSRQMQELMPTRGFQSSVEPALHFGLDTLRTVDSLLVRWPDGRQSVRTGIAANQTVVVRAEDASGETEAPEWPDDPAETLFADAARDLPYEHDEGPLYDLDREPLMPHTLSTEGPALAVADVNGDGLDDVFAGGAKNQPARLLLQRSDGSFNPASQDVFASHSKREDVDAAFFDADGDGDQDLFVVSAGNEFWGNADALRDRLYVNDGTGSFTHAADALPDGVVGNGACVTPGDFDGDGDTDLFVGGRVVAREYGTIPDSYLLENDGSGRFTDVTDDVAPELRSVGMVTDATWADVDGSGSPDLVVVGEWMPITVFSQSGGTFSETTPASLEGTAGWWNSIDAGDFDGDGDPDFIAGNLGHNSLFSASEDEPVRAYINDFDDNGTQEPIVTHYRSGDEAHPVASRDRLAMQMEFVKRKFPDYTSFGGATIEDIVSQEKLETATVREATTFTSVYVETNGDGTFDVRPLPDRAQISPVYDAWTGDVNGDGTLDAVLGGNFHGVTPTRGPYDASYGTVLTGDGAGGWTALPPVESGLYLDGEVRALRLLRGADGARLLLVGRTDATLQTVQIQDGAKPNV